MADTRRIVVVGSDENACAAPVAALRAAGYQPTTVIPNMAHAPEPLPEQADLIVMASTIPVELDGLPVALWGTAPGEGDWLPADVPPHALRACVEALVKAGFARREAAEARRHDEAMRELVNLLSTVADSPDLLYDVACVAAGALGSDRASVYLVGDDPETLFVVGASDDPSVTKLALALSKYPEVRAAMESRATLYLEDFAHSDLLGEYQAEVAARGVGAILVAPLVHGGRAFGALIARWRETHPALGERAVSFATLAASTVAATLRGANILDTIRERTGRVTLGGHLETDRQRAIDHYRDFFESASDGTAVVDADGRILYLNHAAELVTGYRHDGICGQPISTLVIEKHREGLAEIVRQVAAGASLAAFDIELVTVSKDRVRVSVATSSALSSHNAAILAFRDVTEARAAQDELRKTKEFLERLIDSTVDAIVAADIRGNLILFNKGAERIYGYRGEDVLSKMSVERLYPEGVARAVMAQLRSPANGGVGRLELLRTEIVTRDGELVPVNMTAAIIYEHGKETATVGIFSDLRERLKMEQRLLQAQEKLMVTEKQALIAELAGTTAHELNQPLTSIMGYAEL
ncbi:MAG TPA: PAS domain S-box protein, partial [Polyangia bacterium]|nr:PAS domain S-box protein [Polyangia bacterium]